jgi:hypothetical protein
MTHRTPARPRITRTTAVWGHLTSGSRAVVRAMCACASNRAGGPVEHTHTHTHTLTHTTSHTHTHTHIHTCTHIYMYTHTFTYAHIHTYTHTYIHRS